GCGLRSDLERVRGRVVEGIAVRFGHGSTLGRCRLGGQDCGRMDSMTSTPFERTQRVAVLGGGPGGYEAALAAAQLGAEVTLIERVGVGGAAVLTDVVPSKSLIATA